MADNLSSEGREFLDAACGLADRFNDFQVDEGPLMRRLGWNEDQFSRVRNELQDAGYLATMGAPQGSGEGGFWISKAGIELCPEPLGGRDVLQIRD